MLRDKTVLVGVSGGIAAYKAAELVSRLRQLGLSVLVVMTHAATRFVTPLTFESLSGNPVYEDVLARPRQWQVEHIALAELADLMVIAPATADVVGKLANGIADDYLTTVYLALDCPVVIAPAMNHRMYASPQVQSNLQRLRQLPCHTVLEAAAGRLASGAVGLGRLPDPARILEVIEDRLTTRRDLEGRVLLITAGPTREFLDPVRFLSNPSTGKMGFALARNASARGARVVLVTGPTQLEPPAGVEVVRVGTAAEMRTAVLARFPGVHGVIKAAAVSDYRPAVRAASKLKKGADEVQLTLARTDDILAELGACKGDKVLVGFAAETDDVLNNAREKLVRKHLDLIVLNDLSRVGAGFATDTNAVKLIWPSGQIRDLPLMPKDEAARLILDEVARLLGSAGA